MVFLYLIMTRERIISVVIFCLYMMAVGYTCFATPEEVPQLPEYWLEIHVDKLIHFIMFAPFPLFAYQVFKHDKTSFSTRMLILSLIVVAGFVAAIGTEIIQSTLEYRSSEVGDIYADMVGLAAGGLFTALLIFKKKK